jgi:hypothetical protein
MDDEALELAKATAEGTAAGLTRSFHEILSNLIGGWSKQVGLDFEERAALWRLRNAVDRAQRAIDILEDRKAVRRLVPPAIAVPLLEAASLEDKRRASRGVFATARVRC